MKVGRPMQGSILKFIDHAITEREEQQSHQGRNSLTMDGRNWLIKWNQGGRRHSRWAVLPNPAGQPRPGEKLRRTGLKDLIVGTPVLGAAARALVRLPMIKAWRDRRSFQGSSSYWEERYRQGGTSGPGSYGRLAEFKAKVLNDFILKNEIQSIIEFGCGDGSQLALANYPRYVGIDVAESSITACRKRFAGDANKSFYFAGQIPANLGRSDLVLSLDVIYHLVEDRVFEEYMRSLFLHSGRFVVIFSSNKSEQEPAPHVRHREFTRWIETHQPKWNQSGYIPNQYPYDPARPNETSFADFYFFVRQDNNPSVQLV
jgi:SAM-dependent methyltransferase